MKQRVYRGRCVNNEYLEDSLVRFRDSRDDLYTLVKEQEGLEDGVRKDLIRYMNSFFRIINDPRQVERRMIDKCV